MLRREALRLVWSAWMAAIAMVAANSAPAATYYWDTNGESPGLGSAGGSSANWLSNSWAATSSGTGATGPWPNTQPNNADEAVFMGTAGTVNLDADVYANALRFQTHNYTIASSGGALHLAGTNPSITVDLPANNNTTTISAPLRGDNGFTLAGNSLSGGLKFLVLANTSAESPNDFSGTLIINAGGALRLGGGAAREQIPDDVDLAVAGVIDFITSGGASDGKQEKVRDVSVSGANANFSVGNGSNFVVNSMSGAATGSGPGISVNGNTASVPGKLSITGWADGTGHLTLANSRVRVNTTSASFAIGGRILLAGNIYSSGSSEISNNNGGSTPDDHIFDNKALDFTSAAHTIDVAGGTLTFTSRTPSQPLDVTSTHPGGTILTKTGPGVWLYEHATQISFAGTNRIEQGTLRLGASERLANGSNLEVAGGVFDMQGFVERVSNVVLDGGTISGTAAATLRGTLYDVRSGMASVRLEGLADLEKSTAGTVQLHGTNSYSGATTVSAGTLLVNGTHTGGGQYTVAADAVLGGTGTIAAPLAVHGTLAPGATVGTLTVDGPVVFEADSRYAVELSAASADKLIAAEIDLSANPLLEVSVAGEPLGESWLIAEYAGALAGQFDVVTGGYRVDYSAPGQIWLALAVAGDYNGDGIVDAADYTIWRDTLNTTVAPGTGADGTGPGGMPDGIVDQLDYDFWRDRFGNTSAANGAASAASAVPESSTALLALAAIVCVASTATRQRTETQGVRHIFRRRAFSS